MKYRKRAALPLLLSVHVLASWACSSDAAPATTDSPTVTDAGAKDADETTATEDATPHEAGPRLEPAVLSLNLHCLKLEGTTFASNAARFDAIAAVVKKENVVALLAQEVCQNDSGDAKVDLEKALEAITGETWSVAYAQAHRAWEGTADEADEGVAIFSRGELRDEQTVTYRAQAALRRVGLGVYLPALKMRVTTMHLEFADAAVRARQALEQAAATLVDGDGGAALIAGDLNAVAASPADLALEHMGFKRVSTELPASGIDHVYLHRSAPYRATSQKRVFDGDDTPKVSDHPGVLVRLGPAAAESVSVTRNTAKATLAAEQFLTLRGSASPLDWNAGIVARRVSSDEHRVVLTELPPGDFELKFLLGDATWQTGPNVTATAGTEISLTPAL